MSSLLRRLARTYRLLCAAEDIRALGLRTPSGIWVCGDCRHISWDEFASRWHLVDAHAV